MHRGTLSTVGPSQQTGNEGGRHLMEGDQLVNTPFIKSESAPPCSADQQSELMSSLLKRPDLDSASSHKMEGAARPPEWR